ncbi:MAG: anti-sigma factor [Clostridiales bacterium]|nr:anti-sigma factor [Clostridiales bacterium]
MNACDKYIELISAAMDGEISDVDCAALEAHLESCPECRKVSEAFSAISGSFPHEEEVPESFTAGTMAKIKAEAARPTGFRRFISGYGRYTGLAAALVVVLLGVHVFTNGGSKSAMDMAASMNTSAESSMALNGAPKDADMADADGIESEFDYAAGGYSSSTNSSAYGNSVIDADTQDTGAEVSVDTAPVPIPEEPRSSNIATAFLTDSGAVTDIDTLYAEHGYSERFYSVSTLYAPVPEALLELFKADGVSCVYSSANERHYKIPMELLEVFDPDDIFAEIVFDSLTAEYGLVIVITQPEETEDTP